MIPAGVAASVQTMCLVRDDKRSWEPRRATTGRVTPGMQLCGEARATNEEPGADSEVDGAWRAGCHGGTHSTWPGNAVLRSATALKRRAGYGTLSR